MYRAPQIGAPSKRKHLRGYLPIKYELYKPGPMFRWARHTKLKYC